MFCAIYLFFQSFGQRGSSNWVEVRWMVGWGWANIPECLTGLLSSCECLAFGMIAEYSDIDVAAKSKGF